MKALLDMNVVLDVLLVRQPWFAEASQVWDAHLKGRIAGSIAAFSGEGGWSVHCESTIAGQKRHCRSFLPSSWFL